MNRRRACAVLAAAGAMGPCSSRADGHGLSADWEAWKARYLMAEGRVVDALQNGITHSEGQGYALLMAQATGDRAAFERIERWTRAHLLRRGDALMAWRWRPEAPGHPDLQTATDGDLFRAWALLRAERDSKWPGFGPEARRIAGDIAGKCLIPDPRAPRETLLSPFASPEGSGDAVLVNPSYYMSRALRELGASAGRPALVRAADHGEGLLSELAFRDWLPDWLVVSAQGPVEARGYFPGLGYDALRIPLYLIWSGRGDHPAVGAAFERYDALRGYLRAAAVPTVIDRDGSLQQQSDYAGYRAVWSLVAAASEGAARPDLPEADREASYYPATLGLLAEVAAREGGPWAFE